MFSFKDYKTPPQKYVKVKHRHAVESCSNKLGILDMFGGLICNENVLAFAPLFVFALVFALVLSGVGRFGFLWEWLVHLVLFRSPYLLPSYVFSPGTEFKSSSQSKDFWTFNCVCNGGMYLLVMIVKFEWTLWTQTLKKIYQYLFKMKIKIEQWMQH